MTPDNPSYNRFIEIKSPENKIYRSIDAFKVIGINLEGQTLTIYVDDGKMPQTTLTFDTFEEAYENYQSIIMQANNC